MSFETIAGRPELDTNVEFDQLLQEAYSSALDEDYHCDDTHIHELVQEYQDAITNSEQQEEYHCEDPIAKVEFIRPPRADEYSYEDIVNIAKVRLLGRSLIDKARNLTQTEDFYYFKDRIVENNPGLEDTSASIFAIYLLTHSANWHEHHPEIADNEINITDLEQDPESPSPVRVGQWPNGDYVNCLGITIAVSAACEELGLDYMFANEIKYSDGTIAERHQDIVAYLSRIAPEFFQRQEVLSTIDKIQLINDLYVEEEPAINTFFDPPKQLQGSHRRESFHHSVMARIDNGDEHWVQIDPYSLIFAATPINKEEIDKIYQQLKQPENNSSVANVSIDTLISNFYKRFAECFRYIGDNRTQITEVAEQNINTNPQLLMKSLEETILSIATRGFEILDPESKDSDILKKYISHVFEFMVIAMYEDISGDMRVTEAVSEAEKLYKNKQDVRDYGYEKRQKDLDDKYVELFKSAWESICQQIRYDSSAREKFYSYIEMLPLVIMTDQYSKSLVSLSSIHEQGMVDTTSEYCHPEFAIGAMYLNHYATWRKDGRVNLARYLAKLFPSQLIWQSSMQDGPIEDKNLLAVEEIIDRLKPSQLHPLVFIARESLIRR